MSSMEDSALVTWQIDIDLSDDLDRTPEQQARYAAEKALEIHRNPESIATVFDVRLPTGTILRVDLDNDHVRPWSTDMAGALQIVLDLAKQNVLDERDPDMADERARQLEAIRMVEDLAVNQFGDD